MTDFSCWQLAERGSGDELGDPPNGSLGDHKHPRPSSSLTFLPPRSDKLFPHPQEGDEITIEYTPLLQRPLTSRQSHLKSTFSFHCSCSLCSSSAELVEASDARRKEIDGIVKKLAEGGQGGRGEKMELLERMEELVREEGYVGVPEFGPSTLSLALCSASGATADDDALVIRRAGDQSGVLDLPHAQSATCEPNNRRRRQLERDARRNARPT